MKFPAVFNVDNLNGENGFTITSSIAWFASSIAGLGDVNVDGKPDLIIGGGTNLHAPGRAFVVFGAASFLPILDTSSLNGTNGFTIISSSNRFGSQVAGAGDINADGNSDLIVGAYEANKACGDFSGNELDDLWCNQNYSPIGEIYEGNVST